jgi:hypothetical protein
MNQSRKRFAQSIVVFGGGGGGKQLARDGDRMLKNDIATAGCVIHSPAMALRAAAESSQGYELRQQQQFR